MAAPQVPNPDPNVVVTPPAVPPAAPAPNAQLDQLAADLAATRTELARLKTTPPAAPAQPTAPLTKEQLDREFFKNPLESAAAIAQHVAAQYQAQNGMPMETLETIAKNEVRKKDPEVWDKYEAEITGLLSNSPIQFRANINVWNNAFDVVKGRHLSDILEMKGKKTPATPDGPAAPSAPTVKAGAKPPLTEQEKIIADGWKMTDDEYRRGKELLEAGDAAWEGHLTFDSTKARRDARAAKAKEKK